MRGQHAKLSGKVADLAARIEPDEALKARFIIEAERGAPLFDDLCRELETKVRRVDGPAANSREERERCAG